MRVAEERSRVCTGVSSRSFGRAFFEVGRAGVVAAEGDDAGAASPWTSSPCPDPGVTPRLVRAAGRRGPEIHAWAVNRAPEMADLIEGGVHGLITDRPAIARRVNAELAELSPAGRLLLRVRNLLDDEDPAGAGDDTARTGPEGLKSTPPLD